MITKPNSNVVDFLVAVQPFLIRDNQRPLSSNCFNKLSWLLTALLAAGTMNMEALSCVCLRNVLGSSLCYFLHQSVPALMLTWHAGVFRIISHLPSSIVRCYILIDDTDLNRSKVIRRIFGVFKGKHKASGGYANTQRIVVVAMVVLGLRIPIFFSFHRPDPKLSDWHKKRKQNKEAKKRGKKLPHKLGPTPQRRKTYPTLIQIAIKLLRRTKKLLEKIEKVTGKEIDIVAITFDAAFMSGSLHKQVKQLFPGVQIISQIKSSQLVSNKSGHYKTASKYFENLEFQKKTIKIREKAQQVYFCAARLNVKATGAKLFVVAIKYSKEKHPRFVVATDMTWRAEDILTAYSSRWIIEVLFEDLKQYCGLNRRACLQRRSGSCGTVALSMIADICAHSTPKQLKRLSSGAPVLTTGSVARAVRTESIVDTLEEFVSSKEPEKKLVQICDALELTRNERVSRASITTESFFELGPSESLMRDYRRTQL